MKNFSFALLFLLTACGTPATPTFLHQSQTSQSASLDRIESWKLSSSTRDYGLIHLKRLGDTKFELQHVARNLTFPVSQNQDRCLPPCMPGGLPGDSIFHEVPEHQIWVSGELEIAAGELNVHYQKATAFKKYSTGVMYPSGAAEEFSWAVKMSYTVQDKGETMRLIVSNSEHPGFKVGDRLELKRATSDLY